MLRELRVLKGEYSKMEIFAIIIAWLYLVVSTVVVIAASIAYVAIMLEYLKFRREAFPGMTVLLCALTISLAILVIWISTEMIDGIKMKAASSLSKFRLFSLFSLILSFILLACEIFDPSSINQWFRAYNIHFIIIPTFIYHATVFILVDALFGTYKIKKDTVVKSLEFRETEIKPIKEDMVLLQVIEIL